jgi:hypothetical protein
MKQNFVSMLSFSRERLQQQHVSIVLRYSMGTDWVLAGVNFIPRCLTSDGSRSIILIAAPQCVRESFAFVDITHSLYKITRIVTRSTIIRRGGARTTASPVYTPRPTNALSCATSTRLTIVVKVWLVYTFAT